MARESTNDDMIPKANLDYAYVQSAILRRIWYIVIPFVIVSLGVILYCIFAPRIYRAQTLILVEAQQVPGEYVSSTVTADLSDRLRTITQQIKSRTRLEDIINKFDLYPDIREKATMTDAVEAFRDKIEVTVSAGRQAFEVAFQGKDPVKVRDVSEALANLFIEDNLRFRESQTTGTSRFIDREVAKLQEELRNKETAVLEFKEKNRGFLPEDLDQNYRMLDLLQQQIDSINATSEQTKDRKVLLESQLKNLERMEAQFGAYDVEEPVDPLATEDQAMTTGQGWTSPEIDQLRQNLKNLKSRYSDKHPDVIRVQNSIAKLEKEQEEAGNPDGTTGTDESAPLEGASLFEAQIYDLKAQLALINKEIDETREEKKTLKKQMETYRHRIEKTPQVEQALVDLSRGYDQLKRNYENLLQKEFKAGLAENLERSQKGEQFTILDPAKLPDKPVSPQTRKVLAMGFFLALAAGLGLAGLREFVDSSFFRSKDLENELKIPVLVSIPLIKTSRDRHKILVKRALSTAVMVSMASALLIGLYYLWKLDPTIRPTGFG